MWGQDLTVIEAHEKVQRLSIVNDFAETGVVLIQTFNPNTCENNRRHFSMIM